jgi:hypothetical protein
MGRKIFKNNGYPVSFAIPNQRLPPAVGVVNMYHINPKNGTLTFFSSQVNRPSINGSRIYHK